jgi:UDPglucose 6-dehydrogenase
MKIGIVGLGFVGSAIAEAHRSDDLVVRDPKISNSADIKDFRDCSAIYICVPSPERDDGSADTTILASVLAELQHHDAAKDKVLISKVTAPPSAYQDLQEHYPNLVHCPEFLTARNARADYQNSDYFVIGGDRERCLEARSVIRQGVPLVDDKFLITDIRSAALYKYMMNSYLAAKVTFMNEFYQLAQSYGLDWKTLTGLSVFDDRIGYTHLSVPGPDGAFGWGGGCFPKDVNAIICEAQQQGLDFSLLKHVNELNKRHRQQ